MPQINDLLYLLTGRWRDILPEVLNNACLLVLVATLALFFPRITRRVFRPLENGWIRLAGHRKLAIGLCGLLALLINMAIAFWGRWPLPAIHDEFSYLLAADTFASGRLANPTHPMWIFFETFHVIQHPTYASKYPPGQGLMLAAGQLLAGTPVAGLWLGTALSCMALCWMLQQWLRPRWALLGGLLATVHPLTIYWTQSFWGCQPAIVGGALLIGGVRRFLDSQEAGETSAGATPGAWAVGIGSMLLLLTRPSEGMALVGAVLATIGVVVLRGVAPRPWKSLAVIGGLLTLTVFAQGVYNFNVTKSPFKLSYTQHHNTYGIAPLFIWQPFKKAPSYNHAVMRQFHVVEEPPAYLHHGISGAIAVFFEQKLTRLALLHSMSLTLFLASLFLPVVLVRDRRFRLIAAYVLIFLLVVFVEVWLSPHYITPVLAAGFLLSLQGLRRMRAWRWHHKPLGLCAARLMTALSLLSVLSSSITIARPETEGIVFTSPGLRHFAAERHRIAEELEEMPGRHLVLVSYSKNHPTGAEWVYNRADIDSAKVVWARTMSPSRDKALLDYFGRRGRKIWYIDADAASVRLSTRRTKNVPTPS